MQSGGASRDGAATAAQRRAGAQGTLWRALSTVLRAVGVRSVSPHAADEWWTPPPLAWHPRLQRLAILDSKGNVAIHSADAVALRLGDKPECLAHAGIRDIAAVAWRPQAKSFVAVAHAGGVSLWTCDAGATPAPAQGIRGLDAPLTWRRSSLLERGRKQPVTALCWSPCGQFLATGSPADSAFAVWDIATRVCTRLRCGFVGARLLRWSPQGNYLLVAGFDARYLEIWETHTWTCQSWSTGAHLLTDAAWSADEKVVLIALSGSKQLAVLHFVGSAPSLLAHLLPLELPGVAQCDGTLISSIAFDSAAGRLAVACSTRGAAAQHWVCTYALQAAPVYVAKPVGPVLHAPAGGSCNGSRAAHAAVAFQRCAVESQRRCLLAISWPDGTVALAV